MYIGKINDEEFKGKERIRGALRKTTRKKGWRR
jgi:hypothetical protein